MGLGWCDVLPMALIELESHDNQPTQQSLSHTTAKKGCVYRSIWLSTVFLHRPGDQGEHMSRDMQHQHHLSSSQ